MKGLCDLTKGYFPGTCALRQKPGHGVEELVSLSLVNQGIVHFWMHYIKAVKAKKVFSSLEKMSLLI